MMRTLVLLVLLPALVSEAAAAPRQRHQPAPATVAGQGTTAYTSTWYTITITIVPEISSVDLSNTTVSTVGPANAGTVVGAVSVTTNPPGGSYSGTVVLGGTDAASFALTNGGALPCNLTVGPNNLPAGNYAITLTAE